jgi:4-amino-4-deoxy-L-arabinose transferase-like glycosyltransferase
MSCQSSQRDRSLRREALVVAVLTVVGGSLRLWSLGRLGLVHFDEGIYALAGLWIYSPKGLAGIDPIVVAYAPPGFPILVGLAYSFLGGGDLSAILVSIVTGILTIPAVGWLARRSFGQGAGAAAAACAAVAAPHVWFSRMALADASFLLFWVVALGQGQRFLERPRPSRAISLGFSVGMAQLFKYNGWLAGAIVALSAAVLMVRARSGRTSPHWRAIWGWGIAAAVVAAVVYWPWFEFVSSHGGYGSLLAHHRSYMSGITSWPGHLLAQLAQERALSGRAWWLFTSGLLAASAAMAARGELGPKLLPRALPLAIAFAALCLLPHPGWWAAVGWILVVSFSKARAATPATDLLAVGWAALVVLTPFYHPYARLFLPLQALGWMFLGAAFLEVRSQVMEGADARGAQTREAANRFPWLVAASVFAAAIHALVPSGTTAIDRSFSPLEPTDSLRRACRSLGTEVPRHVRSLPAYVRPPVLYYLGESTAVSPQPDLDHLVRLSSSSAWALLDTAMIRRGSESRETLAALEARWLVARAEPTALNLPTLLDVDPASAGGEKVDADASLFLLRAKLAEATR